MSDPQVDVVDQDTTTVTAPESEAVNENKAGNEPESKEEVEKAVEEKAADNVNKTEAKESKTNGHSKFDSKNYHGNKGKYDNKRRERGSKFDPSVVPISDDATKIRNQVEFYFGDSNLPTDKHLWALADGSENKPVLVSEIHKFGRMKRFQPYSAVVEALRQSTTLDVSGPDGEETIARKVAYNPNQPKHASLDRSVYVKGFGEELPSSQFDIEAFFTPYGPTNAVRLRRTEERVFKGSVFVEFADDETAKKFLDLDPKPQFKGSDLQIMSKKDYEALRVQEIQDGTREPNQTKGSRRGGFRSDKARGDRNHGDRDPDDWKKRREEDQRSGFRDNKRDRDGRHGGRGGRGGRGRGGDRRPREDNRNQEREKSNDKTESKDEEPSRKRTREDDANANEAPAKKVDIKGEVSAEAS